jgi:hypothetical protein
MKRGLVHRMYNRYCNLILKKKNNSSSSNNSNNDNNNKNNDKLYFIITEERKCRRFNPGIHTFSKNLGAASKFQAPGG